MTKGKYLGLDFGGRRVGVAITDLNKEVIFPRKAIVYKNQSDLIEELKTLCETESIIKVIIGLPIQMDGTVGEQVTKTYEFGKRLSAAIPSTPVEYFDERLTTQASKKCLYEQGINAKKQKEFKDSISAQLILETYLKSKI